MLLLLLLLWSPRLLLLLLRMLFLHIAMSAQSRLTTLVAFCLCLYVPATMDEPRTEDMPTASGASAREQPDMASAAWAQWENLTEEERCEVRKKVHLSRPRNTRTVPISRAQDVTHVSRREDS